MDTSQRLKDNILHRLQSGNDNAVFATRDFLDLGPRASIDQALSRLARRGTVRRIGRGVYDLPRINTRLGLTLSPSPEQVAAAVANSSASRIQVAGAQAANALGISNQVPARIVYLTDGRPKTIHVGNQILVFRQASPRNMATAGRISGTVIQALRHLGKKHVDNQVIAHLHHSLTTDEKAVLKEDRFNAPGWMQPVFDQILSQGSD